MAKQQTDNELNLKRKARRRLIGAVALTLAVVVVLPMVLDSEPKPSGKDIDLRIPAPDKVGEFVPGIAASEVAGTLPLASAVAAVPAATAVSAVAQAEIANPLAAPSVQPAAASAARNEVQGKIQQPANKQAEAKAAEAKTPEPKAIEPKAVESKTAEAKSAKTQDKADAVDSFVVQVGAYSSAATAKQELDKLKKWGFKKAYTEKAGDKMRVRVGPYAERDKAEQVRRMLEKHGIHPVVANSK
ncbi:MAG: SPOR domain-containing protein [Gallionella sp.]|nr:SPOR domain-containing protein [Gallionella sp.]